MSENSLLAKIEGLYDKFNTLQEQLSDPDVMSDMKKGRCQVQENGGGLRGCQRDSSEREG